MSVEERYSRATRSNHLRLKETESGDTETLIAAGMSDYLGTRLLRLRAEFDGVHKRHAMAQAKLIERAREAADLRRAKHTTAEAREQAAEAIRRLLAAADHEAKQALAFIRLDLKSQPHTMQAVNDYAQNQAQRSNSQLPAVEITRIVGEVLDHWLDRTCPKCDGRGLNGGYNGEAQTICRACRGTRNRKVGLYGKTTAGQMFAERLYADLDYLCAMATGQMTRKLRT